jgi:hypothetical protein
MAKLKLSDTKLVEQFISNLDTQLQEVVEQMRQLILATSPLIGEHIKWNSPSFYYIGVMAPFDPKEYKRDLLVCNIHSGKILLIFPTGAKVLNNPIGMNYPDGRKVVEIKDLADLKAKENAIREIIKAWLGMVE